MICSIWTGAGVSGVWFDLSIAGAVTISPPRWKRENQELKGTLLTQRRNGATEIRCAVVPPREKSSPSPCNFCLERA
jgi:hypothetical protein